VHIVSATRHTEKTFWRQCALGRSLKPWLSQPGVSAHIYYENTRGLPSVYNESLQAPALADVLVFLHDDIWLDDPSWLDKVLLATTRYDVVGVAGNTRRSRRQPSWLHQKIENGKFVRDNHHLSGMIGNGQLPKGRVIVFGPTPAGCELLDGVFMAVRSQYVLQSHIQFDTRFDFHFYDLDFCRSARKMGLSLGTWPIEMTHQSPGEFGPPQWQAGHVRYLEKWRT
jgi:GT2 family glycosyltransferase